MDTSTNDKKESNNDKISDDSSMNEELKEWLQQEKKNIEEFKKSDQCIEKKENLAHGVCEICGDNSAKFTCFKCGQKVCPTCFFNILGVCKKCVPKGIAEKWDGTNPDWEKVLGVEWVD